MVDWLTRLRSDIERRQVEISGKQQELQNLISIYNEVIAENEKNNQEEAKGEIKNENN